MDEQELLKRVARGDAEAFSNIYTLYKRRLFSAAFDRLKDVKQSEDLVQDVFLKLWERRETLDIADLNAYLYSCVRYSIFGLVARDKVSNHFYSELKSLSLQESPADVPLIEKELAAAYKKLVESLPVQRRTIFKLRYEQEMKTVAIAGHLNISQKTVQNSLLSSYQQLRALVAQFLVAVLWASSDFNSTLPKLTNAVNVFIKKIF